MRADIVHGHDWQTGLLPVLLRHAEQRHGVTLAMKTIYTVHNIAFQGVFPMRSFYRTNLPEELQGIDGVEFYGQMSMMKAGLLFADRVTTVSPRYSLEIQTQEFGCGLDGGGQDASGLSRRSDQWHRHAGVEPGDGHAVAGQLFGAGSLR